MLRTIAVILAVACQPAVANVITVTAIGNVNNDSIDVGGVFAPVGTVLDGRIAKFVYTFDLSKASIFQRRSHGRIDFSVSNDSSVPFGESGQVTIGNTSVGFVPTFDAITYQTSPLLLIYQVLAIRSDANGNSLGYNTTISTGFTAAEPIPSAAIDQNFDYNAAGNAEATVGVVNPAYQGGYYIVAASIRSIVVTGATAVPEPGLFTLAGLGFGLVTLSRFRSRGEVAEAVV